MHPIIAERPRRWATRRGRRLAGLAALPLGAAVLGALVIATGQAQFGLEAPAQEIDLPEADDVEPGRGLTGADRAEALAPFAPPRTLCEPEGCERWRRPVPTDPWGRVGTVDGNVVVLEEDQFVLVDPATGEEVWSESLTGSEAERTEGAGTSPTSLGSLVRLVPSVGDWRGRWGPVEFGGDAPLLLADGADVVELRGADGAVRWTVHSGLRSPAWVLALDDHLVLADNTGQDTTMVALGRSGGDLRWSRTWEGAAVAHVAPDTVVLTTPLLSEPEMHAAFGAPVDIARSVTAEFVDPWSGDVRSMRKLPPGTWLASFGPWLVPRAPVGPHDAAAGAAGWPVDHGAPDRLLDPRDGSLVAEVPGYLDHPHVEVGGLVVGLVGDQRASGDGRPRVTEAVALDGDGEIAWREPLITDGSSGLCCASVELLDDHDAVVVRAGPHTDPTVLDAATGDRRIDHDVVLPSDEDGFQVLGRSGDLEFGFDGTGEVLRGPDGAWARVVPGGWPVMVDPLVVLTDEALLGVDLQPPAS